MIRFNGKLNRSRYWINLLLALAGIIFVSGSLLWLLDIQNAEEAGASTVNQALSVIFLILYFISIVYFLLMIIGAIIRRAHDISDSLVWIIVGLFVPLGFIVIGLLPARP